jgi:hypothetical protein
MVNDRARVLASDGWYISQQSIAHNGKEWAIAVLFKQIKEKTIEKEEQIKKLMTLNDETI